MSALRELAEQLGADQRTLRRGAESGLIRTERPSPRGARVTATERVYLHRHWPMLSALRRALRTEPNVAMAVVFGSFARGQDVEGSDVDLLVALREDEPFRAADLESRLSATIARDVQVVPLARAGVSLLAEALKDGRVLVDREQSWPRLQACARQVAADARAQRARLRRDAASAVRELTHGV